MKTIMKNIVLASLVLVSFGTDNLNALHRGASAPAPQPVITTEEERITSVETAHDAYKKLVDTASTASTMNFHEELLGFGQHESMYKNSALSREQQLVQYKNLTTVFNQLTSRITQEKSKASGDETTKTRFATTVKNKAVDLLHQIAFNQEQWKTLNQNIKVLDHCFKKDAEIENRMDQKISLNDNDPFSIEAGLDSTNESPSNTFVAKLLKNVQEWKKFEQLLLDPKITEQQIKDHIVEPLIQAALRTFVAQKQIDDKKTKANITTVEQLREFLTRQQNARTMLLECSLNHKNALFIRYKVIGFEDEMKSISTKSSLKSIGIPAMVLAAIGLFIFAGQQNYLTTNIPNPMNTSAPINLQALYTQGKDFVTGLLSKTS
jgi:hypothetical protein